MKLVKLLLSLISIIGLISMCGCVGSNADSGASTTTNSNKEYAEYGTVEVVKQQPYSSVSTNPDDYKSWVPGTPEKVVVRIGMRIHDSRLEFYQGRDIILPQTFDSEYDFVKFASHERNITDIYNKTKYQKQYEHYTLLIKEIKEWESKYINRKPIVIAYYSNGDYKILYDGGKDLEEYLIQNGYAYRSTESYNSLEKAYNYSKGQDGRVKHYLDYYPIQVEAEKNKKGIWSIDFSN